MIWGITPGRKNKLEKVQADDIALFSRSKAIFASAVVTYKTNNEALAKKLWGLDSKSKAWEYIYFLSELKAQNIPYVELNRVVPYDENFVIRGFMVLDEIPSQHVIHHFDLQSETYYPEVSTETLAKLQMSGDLNTIGSVKRRKEQPVIQARWFRNQP